MPYSALPDDLASDRDLGEEHPCRYLHGSHLLVLSHGRGQANSGHDVRPSNSDDPSGTCWSLSSRFDRCPNKGDDRAVLARRQPCPPGRAGEVSSSGPPGRRDRLTRGALRRVRGAGPAELTMWLWVGLGSGAWWDVTMTVPDDADPPRAARALADTADDVAATMDRVAAARDQLAETRGEPEAEGARRRAQRARDFADRERGESVRLREEWALAPREQCPDAPQRSRPSRPGSAASSRTPSPGTLSTG
jgi:hypothetical protein